MGTISMRIEDELLVEVASQAKALPLTRTEYLKRAIVEMKEKVAHDRRRQRLQEASRKVRRESMRVNLEFADIEDVPNARNHSWCRWIRLCGKCLIWGKKWRTGMS